MEWQRGDLNLKYRRPCTWGCKATTKDRSLHTLRTLLDAFSLAPPWMLKKSLVSWPKQATYARSLQVIQAYQQCKSLWQSKTSNSCALDNMQKWLFLQAVLVQDNCDLHGAASPLGSTWFAFMANKLAMGNHWVNTGTAKYRHKDMGERARLWVMETGHWPAGGRVTW